MKKLNPVRLLVALSFCFVTQFSWAQTPLVKDMSIAPDEAKLELNTSSSQSYFMEISGPHDLYMSEELTDITDIHLLPQQEDGTAFADGTYRIQITPVYQLTEDQKSDLISLRQKGDQAGILAYREANDLPTEANVYAINFGIRNGEFIQPNKREQALRTPGVASRQQNYADPATIHASLNYFETDLNPTLVRDNSMDAEMQVFTQDVIVQGSICVGFDCNSNESFGFDTERIKENNLRIHFDDTSSSASFPSNDWRIAINDTSNGGASYFAVEDATAGRIPFRIVAGAPANSLHIDDSGDVGIGTSTPLLEVHIADGDSPGLRIEQNGSSGFASQTWDIAGNETNFFVRDVTNGSRLPFKIRPGAPDNSLYVDTDGDIGLGVANPSNKLQVEQGDVYIKSGSLGINTEPSASNVLKVEGNTRLVGTLLVTEGTNFRGNTNFQMSAGNSSNFTGASFSSILYVDADNDYVGIGTSSPGHVLEVGSDDVAKPNGGPWLGASDRRLKTNIRNFNDGLSQLMAIRPVRYNYNGLLDLPTDQDFVGIIAQEMQAIAPYTIRDYNRISPDGDQYLAFDGSALTYILVNAVQEQQEIIEDQAARISELEAQAAQLAQLQQQVAALAKVVGQQNTTTTSTTTTTVVETEER